MRNTAFFNEVNEIPASWHNCWEAFVEWTSSGMCEELVWRAPSHAVETFDLPIEVMPLLSETCARIDANEQLKQLAEFWHYLIFHLPGSTGDHPNDWPLPARSLGRLSSLFPLVILVSGTNHAEEAFRKKGISLEIMRATLAFGGLYVRDYWQRWGIWGLSELGWLRNHVRANIFRMGRLVFNEAKYSWPFRAYRNRLSGEVRTLCEAVGKYRKDGLADGTNGLQDPDAWTPLLEVGEHSVKGHCVTGEGRALLQPEVLSSADWEQILAPGDSMIEVHIPSGSKLAEEECREAYLLAAKFFPDKYPQNNFTAFTCWSWLLDPGLAEMLHAESNIVRFQRPYHSLPVVGDHRQAYDLVFGKSDADPTAMKNPTGLQRAIAVYTAAGNQMRSAAGFISWEEMMALVDEQE